MKKHFKSFISKILLLTIVSVLIFSGWPQTQPLDFSRRQSLIVYADTLGPNGAGTGTSQADVGTIPWTTPENVTTNDATNAISSLTKNGTSHYLMATNFGFSIPAGSTINGIIVEVLRSDGNTSANGGVLDSIISIIKGGVVNVTNKADTVTFWPITESFATYGTATDLWGDTWAAADVNASTFGVAISVVNKKFSGGGGAEVAQVNFVQITVDYTLVAATNPTFTLNAYRWYADNDLVDPTDPWGNPDLAEETSIELLAMHNPPNSIEELRLRTNLTVNTENLTAATRQFKLQYKAGIDENCTTGTWTDVGPGQSWEFATSGVSDGTTLVSNLSTSNIAGQYAKTNPTTTNTNGATVGQNIEYDFHIIGTTIATATKYSFRVVVSDDTLFDAYTVCPTLRTEPGMDNFLRHGTVFTPDDGLKQSFFWTE